MVHVQEHLEQVDEGMDIMRENVSSLMNNMNQHQAEVSYFYILLRDWPVMKCDPSPGNFWVHFLFSSKIKTTYPWVHPPISSSALRPSYFRPYFTGFD